MTDAGQHVVGIDIGGTFTDVVVLTDDNKVEVLKVPSTPPHFEQAIFEALSQLDKGGNAPTHMAALAHGTTVATNAVLERRGARVVLFTTRGFRDVLELGQMRRPGLVDPEWLKPTPLVPRRDRIEVSERIDDSGEIVEPLDVEALIASLDVLDDAESVAVCLLHAYLNPVHEHQIRDAIQSRFPDLPVSLSSDVLPELGEYARLSTTVVNAYVQPVIERYVGTLCEGLDKMGATRGVQIMQSNGALCDSSAAVARPVTIIESGPAAGVTAAAELARRCGLPRVLTFDMGGTTAKASLVEDSRPGEAHGYEVGGGMNAGRLLSAGGGYMIGVPSIDIAEVGAGGGSQFWIDGAGHPQVGPVSSGAVPGPVCYGLGGESVTVTDANLLLGYLSPEGLAGNTRAVSSDIASEAIREQSAEPLGLTIDEAAFGIYQIANAAMVRALRAVSTERGRDPREFALVAFGGSGPLHAVALAREIEVGTVIVPQRAGLFSAVGLLTAPTRRDFTKPWLRAPDAAVMETELAKLEALAGDELNLNGETSKLVCERLLDVRYLGQASYLAIPIGEDIVTTSLMEHVRNRFDAEYEKTYGHSMPQDAVEVVNLRVRAGFRVSESDRRGLFSETCAVSEGQTNRSRDAYFGPDHGRVRTPVLRREQFEGRTLEGPVLIDDMDTTTVVPPGCTVEVDQGGNLVITVDPLSTKDFGEVADAKFGKEIDVITAEVMRNALTSIADEMAVTVVRTARSQIVRDTMDFSTAVLDSQGRLVSLGLTLLLQLGSLPDVIETIQRKFKDDIHPGDIFVGNDPSEGGMHLPDVYLLKPVFGSQGLIAWTTVIAQHADIGGLSAGSTSPAAKNIFQEGLQIPFVKLCSRGVLNDSLVAVIRGNSRVPEIVWSDLCSQRAACERGEAGILKLVERYGEQLLAEVMRFELDSTEQLVRSEIAKLPDGRYEFTDHLDDDGFDSGPIPISVSVTVTGDAIDVDFEGTSPQVASALNSTMSFTRAAVYAALVWAFGRRENMNNAGLFRAVNVSAPEGTIVNGSHPAARGARGTTGFRIIDAVLGALHQAIPGKVPAAGEGGLSVVSFGGRTVDGAVVAFNDIFSAGWGARSGADGIDGTSPIGANLASTPIEMIERYHPVRMNSYALVPDSGGLGEYRGGMAVERSFTFLGTEGDLQVRSDRRDFRPYGLEGGGSGTASETILVNPCGTEEQLPSKVTRPVETGTTVRQVTAGSGGYGHVRGRNPEAVLADVLDGKVSVMGAATGYGVRVDAKAGTVERIEEES